MEYRWRLGEAKEGRGAARPSIIPCVIVRLIDYVMVCTLCSFPFQTWYHPRSAYFLCSKYHQGFGPTRRTVKQHTDGWMNGWMDEISIQLDCEWNQQHNNQRMDGWMDGWNLNTTRLWMKPTTQQSMDGWMKSQHNSIVNETNNTTMDGWMDGWTNEWMNEISIQLSCRWNQQHTNQWMNETLL